MELTVGSASCGSSARRPVCRSFSRRRSATRGAGGAFGVAFAGGGQRLDRVGRRGKVLALPRGRAGEDGEHPLRRWRAPLEPVLSLEPPVGKPELLQKAPQLCGVELQES